MTRVGKLASGIGPCAADPVLFDSCKPLDHQRARVVCSTCPYVRACLQLACDIADGRARARTMPSWS